MSISIWESAFPNIFCVVNDLIIKFGQLADATQPASCSKLTVETLRKDVKYVQSQQ